jgi:endonuclease YncB( thermonuclease family)
MIRFRRPIAIGFWVAVAVTLLAGLASAQKTGRPPGGTGQDFDEKQLEGYIRAVQGDTLDAKNARSRIGIGIVGVSAPAANTPCGRQSTAFTQELVAGGVQLIEDPTLTLDGRKRRMYHVMTPDGQSIAEQLVSAGLARADGRGANREQLAELEATARKERRGCLWEAGG